MLQQLRKILGQDTIVDETVESGMEVKDIIEQIHNEFNNKGDELVKEAQSIIDGISIHNEEKSRRLKSIGFSQTREVVDYSGKIAAKEEQQRLAEALTGLQVEFPQYRFITTGAAMVICNKYNLVLGDISQYTGFVPEKNLKQIEDFYAVENSINFLYNVYYMGYGIVGSASKLEFDMQKSQGKAHHSTIYREKTPLCIAAPLKDMDATGYKLKGRVFEKDIPDPVVLAPVKRNGVDLYCIITAWGDEASDEMVVNQQMN